MLNVNCILPLKKKKKKKIHHTFFFLRNHYYLITMRREKIHNVEDLYVMQAIIKSHDSISLALILT